MFFHHPPTQHLAFNPLSNKNETVSLFKSSCSLQRSYLLKPRQKLSDESGFADGLSNEMVPEASVGECDAHESYTVSCLGLEVENG